ncbi:odorant receptor 49b-like [Zophobas morio]|uniref:odorant receptor 49b-like n=1 Tax=Zophobas morio TaxID=2755281 RepID=UPI003083E345
MWPKFSEELNPSYWHYFRVSIFLSSCGALLLAIMIHIIMAIKYKIYQHLSGNNAGFTSMLGMIYMSIIYVHHQPKIALLLKDLSNFGKYGKPSGFDKVNKRLNFWAPVPFMYPTVGVLFYSFTKFKNKSICELANEGKAVKDMCGVMYSFWIPFDINYFPVIQITALCVATLVILLVRLRTGIAFQALEIIQHVILRIRQLNVMIEDIFNGNDDLVTKRKKLTNCILYHQEIIDMSEKLNKYFSGIMVTHFVMTSIICGCIEKEIIDGTYYAATHLISWIITLFLVSFGGQKLMDASQSVTDTLVATDWYSGDIYLQKDILFMLQRSQKYMCVHVGSFGPLSYEFFLGVIKMSYSILAMLKS